MKVFIATDVTVRLCEDRIYARNKYSTIFRRYYSAFGKIVFCCRTEKIEKLVDDCDDITAITADVISANSLFKGLLGKYNDEILKAMTDCDLVICRCPSIYAYRAADCAKKLKKPILAESMGCAWDAYWNHGLSGKAIAPYMFLKMKQVVKNAEYASYVTNDFLQKRYPRHGSSLAASNVLISDVDDCILKKRIERIQNGSKNFVSLMTTAAVNVKYKGQQYVIEAIPKINQVGVRVKYNIVGEGDPTFLKSIARKYSVEDQVFFPGRLPLDQVFRMLDETDIYIQPSLQEGLPRSVIEAMSRGCITIGANTAGIPELLDKNYVVKRKNVDEIAEKIIEICRFSEDVMIKNAARNFEFSKKFVADSLEERRNIYYTKIKRELGGVQNVE